MLWNQNRPRQKPDHGFEQGNYLFNPEAEAAKARVFTAPELSGFGVPFGFESHPVAGLPLGYPVLFDVSLTAARAMDLMRYVREGDFLGPDAASLTVRLMTYNGEDNMFAAVSTEFTFLPSGETLRCWYQRCYLRVGY